VSPVTAGAQDRQTASEIARRGRVFLAIAAAVVALGASAWMGWRRSRPHPVRDHWDAVARGRNYLQYGRPDLAIQAVFDVRDEAPGAGEAMTVAGLALIRLGEYGGARRALERAVKLQPNQFDAALTLAELNLALGNGQRGLELLEQAARLRPREFRVWLTMARVLNDRGDRSRAISAYEKAVGLNPAHREALIGLIAAQVRGARPDQAEPWIARALQRYPDDPVVLGLAARAAYHANRLDEAISLADRALARDPRSAHAMLARAQSLVARSQWENALPEAERAVAAEPNEMDALNLLLRIEMRLGLTRRAQATLARRERAQERLRLMNQLAGEIQENPNDPQLPWRMGQAAWESGMTLLASRCFRAALALDPNFQPARNSLGKLQAAHPELARAPGPSISLPAAASLLPQTSTPSP
jgi:tetratricopeptide (TPR) repeat protein